MKRTNRIFFMMLLCILGTLGTLSAASALHAGSVVPAPANPEFIQYLEDLRSGTAAHRLPPKAYLLPPKARSRTARALNAALPEKFDLVEKGWVTPVKDQRHWGTCWDFTTMEALESNLKKETGVEYELSELHLGFFSHYNESEGKPAFDQIIMPDENPIFDSGGDHIKSRAILSRGTGPVYEKDAPYPKEDVTNKEFWRDYPKNPEALKRELLAAKPAFRLKESLQFAESDDIKRALTEYGGLWIGVDSNKMRDGSPYIYNDGPEADHAVLLVGWDDTISKAEFKHENVEHDGAWKIQNSWGVSMGDHGYYWISYDDVSIFNGDDLITREDGATSFVAMPADSYHYTYSHDPLGSVFSLIVKETAKTANVFTAERDEDIVYVGFTTEGYDIQFGIQIYKDLPAGGMPDDGTPAFSEPLTGTADFPGYRTVKLNAPVPLAKGERFAVAMTFTNGEGGSVYIPVEARVDEYSSQASAKPGESFVYDDGAGWEEVMKLPDEVSGDITIQNTNLTIKAFTKGSGGSSGGCSAGASIGMFTLLLAALIPLARGRKYGKCKK